MTNEAIIEAIDRVHTHGMHSSIFLIIGFPHETTKNVMETIRLMGQAKPGRFRWTFFYPFPGTQSYQISRDGGFIDEQKMKQLTNFTDQSCLVFDPDHDLFLQKVGKVMPWFVNAFSDLRAADLYKPRVDELLSMDKNQWNQVAPTLIEEDKKLSQQCCDKRQTHYAIKYNRFMGVISDYFLNEE
jgi:tRNA A37 methylthiotransferase MiaB